MDKKLTLMRPGVVFDYKGDAVDMYWAERGTVDVPKEDPNLVDDVLGFLTNKPATFAMPVVPVDQEGYPVTHEEYLAGKSDPFEYPSIPFSFMAALCKDAPERTYKRRGVLFKGDGFPIPPFDPFHDHLTTLIVKDRRVQRKVSMLFGLEGLRKYPEWFAGVSVDTALLGAGEIVVNDCIAFKRSIPGITRHW